MKIEGLVPFLSPLPQLLLHLGLIVRPSPYRWLLWPLIAGITGLLYPYSTNPEGIIGVVIRASDFLLLTDVQRSFRHFKQTSPISDAPLWERVKWSLKLVAAMRGVGWNFEPTSVLPLKPTHLTRRAFLISRLRWALFYLFAWDAIMLAERLNPCFVDGAPPLAEHAMVWRVCTMVQFAIWSTCMLNIAYTVMALVSVAAGFSEPSEWPQLFGSFGDAYTLRRFWGRTWHQVLRRKLSAHGKYLAHDILHLTPGHGSSSYVQLYTAFFLSGIIHTRVLADRRPLRFFLFQAVAIMFEDGVIALGKKAGWKGGRLLRWAGYVWVFCWFLFVIPPWWDSMKESGMFKQTRGFSVLLEVFLPWILVEDNFSPHFAPHRNIPSTWRPRSAQPPPAANESSQPLIIY
ncbi:Acetyltransferase sirH [Hypsizygus marmoreus]|uniref:Acetyltransferase sirH n=1 Tax=Hypsizygus marmoreus TaxID=39966 RepID=A0A369JMP4_HYPMA|nr:Acetyltransferase sirH [Hypsizygus marmoreus]